LPKPIGIQPGEPEIGDHDVTARAQHTDGFVDRRSPRVVVRQVVDRQVTHDEIKRRLRKLKVGHVPGVQFDPVGDALGFRVRKCRLHAVAGLVGPPDVHAHSTSTWHQLGRRQQHRATPAAQVEHPFVAPQSHRGQQAGPHFELSSPTEPPHAQTGADQNDGDHGCRESRQRSSGRQPQGGQKRCGKA
jgi:hypothetical protein